MGAYVRALVHRDFRRLFIGATLSSIGDGMSFVALAWLVLNRPDGTTQLGLLAVCYTAPVFAGGWVAGYVLDRFDKRFVIAVDCLVRGSAFAALPISVWLGRSPAWLAFVVAGVFGLFKMVPLAGFPAAIPDLVRDEDLNAANGLEGLSYGVAGIVGPALAGLLIASAGAATVLAIDAVTYFVFGALAVSVSRPLRPASVGAAAPAGFGPVLRFVARDPAILSTTIAFMAFNIAEGMLLVVAPWLARTMLGGAPALGGLLGLLAAGELAGSFIGGARRGNGRPLLAIGSVQLLAAAGFLAILTAPAPLPLGAAFAAVGLFSAPMTIWAQSLRMRRLPPSYRGRAFAALRTVMQATPPIGAALATPLLSAGQFGAAAVTMAAFAGLPALAVLVMDVAGAGATDEAVASVPTSRG